MRLIGRPRPSPLAPDRPARPRTLAPAPVQVADCLLEHLPAELPEGMGGADALSDFQVRFTCCYVVSEIQGPWA